MYCEDTSTSSSEDEASTAASATASSTTTTTTTTADMCRSEVRNGEKVVRCTGCGYTSDRRANVTRHYRRIHAVLKREKYRQCPCGDVFQTKWEFYNHCVEQHPSFRQSSYTTTHVYKLKETKSEQKQQTTKGRPRTRSDQTYRSPVRRPRGRSDQSYRAPVRKSLVTRASTRKLRSQETRSTSNSESSTSGFSITSETSSTGTFFIAAGDTSSRKESSFHSSESEDTGYENSATSFAAFSSLKSEDTGYEDSTTSFTAYRNPENEDTNDEKSISSFIVFRSSESEDTGDENAMTSLAHLPIKKRYMESVRRVLGDITNRSNVEVQKVNSNNNNKTSQVSVRDLYLSKMNEKQRAFIGHIDFDELDAILKLRDLKKAI